MTPKRTPIAALAAFLFCLVLAARAQAQPLSTVAAAAARFDAVCDQAAASLAGIGQSYAKALAAASPPGQETRERWLALAGRQGGVTGLPLYPAGSKREPAYQSANPALYSYAGPLISPQSWMELAALAAIAPQLRQAHDAMGLSWVYLTTTHDNFVIYPYLPLTEAMHNDKPTRQVFYLCADFAGPGPGWSEPYMDLAGAGMMVTVSAPVIVEGALAGVVSRDITLRQAGILLDAVVCAPGGLAFVMEPNGRAVAAAGDLAAEIETVALSDASSQARLYYRPAESLRAEGVSGAVASLSEPARAAGEKAMALARYLCPGEQTSFTLTVKRAVYQVGLIKAITTGWLFVDIVPAAK